MLCFILMTRCQRHIETSWYESIIVPKCQLKVCLFGYFDDPSAGHVQWVICPGFYT